MKPSVIIILLCLCPFSEAQEVPVSNSDYFIIASSGLNLRAKPSLNSEVLTKLSYGEKIERVDDSEVSQKINNLESSWVKVKYKNVTGFLYDAYLIKEFRNNFPTKKINKDFALLYPICTCIPNFQYTNELNWFGVFKGKSGDFAAKQIKPSYHLQQGVMGKDICISTDASTSPEFIIGAKWKTLNLESGLSSPTFKNLEPNTKDPINKDMHYDEQTGALVYCYDNRDIDFSAKDLHANDVVWRGDLNNDSFDDFIVEYGNKESKLILKLSSHKEGTLAYHDVAEFYGGYCC